MSTSSGEINRSDSLADMAAANREAESSGAAGRELMKAFGEFVEKRKDYYSNTFLKIQRNKLSFFNFNVGAMLGSFVWAALRGNWFLFWVSFAFDMMAASNLGLVYRYSQARVAAETTDKAYLVTRYTDWTANFLFLC